MSFEVMVIKRAKGLRKILLQVGDTGRCNLVRGEVATLVFLIVINSAAYSLRNSLVWDSAEAVATAGTYLQYAEQTAQKVQQKMWDPLYGGYFEIMNRSWNEILHPYKEFIYTYWQKAFCYLYDRTGNATYLEWAMKITDVEIAYAWDSVNGGWYDEYNRTWGQDNLPQSRAYIKNAAVQGSMINMLIEVYSRTGNTTYYEYAVKTADFLISNFHDPVYGGFYRTYNQSRGQPQDTGKGIEDSYGQVSYGLLKLYELTHNSAYLNLSKEAMEFTINHLWDSTYGGWLTEVDRTGSVIINDRKYPNEEIWPVFGGFAYYYKITGNLTALNYVCKTMDYIDSKLWDPVYGGWFRSIWRNNTIRDDTKTAWDLAGEPWMIWEVYRMTGNTTYQEMARKGLDWVLNTVMYDTVFGGVVTEVDRTGTTITDSVKDVEVESDAIASFSCVTDRDFTPISLTGNLLQAKYLAEKVQQYMWDDRYGGYFYTMNRTWGLKNSDKTSTMLIIMGLINLYERSGNTTYLVWAENAVNFVLSNAWDKVNGGVYGVYNRSWCPKTTVKSLQRQAELLRVLIDLYRHTNHQKYYDYANRTAEFILAHYHDAQYGGQYKTYDQNTGSPVTTNKDAEVSLGSFGWGMMYWYSLTSNGTALEYTKEANDFIWTYLRDEIYGGLITEVDRTGSIIVNDRKYPNEIIWGTLGMLEYYRVTGNTTVKGWIQELFSYVRNVMWDPSYGGWFRSLWRNNTVRYSTKEGWSQTEQPWFWWFAYSILGDNYYADVARLSVNWTRTYLHDTVYSGFFLELYQNSTLYDDDKVDCVEGAGISALALVEDYTAQHELNVYHLKDDTFLPVYQSYATAGTIRPTDIVYVKCFRSEWWEPLDPDFVADQADIVSMVNFSQTAVLFTSVEDLLTYGDQFNVDWYGYRFAYDIGFNVGQTPPNEVIDIATSMKNFSDITHKMGKKFMTVQSSFDTPEAIDFIQYCDAIQLYLRYCYDVTAYHDAAKKWTSILHSLNPACMIVTRISLDLYTAQEGYDCIYSTLIDPDLKISGLSGFMIKSPKSTSELDQFLSLVANHPAPQSIPHVPPPKYNLTINTLAGIGIQIDLDRYNTPITLSLGQSLYLLRLLPDVRNGTEFQFFDHWADLENTTDPQRRRWSRRIHLASNTTLTGIYKYPVAETGKGVLEIHCFDQGTEVASAINVEGVSLPYPPMYTSITPLYIDLLPGNYTIHAFYKSDSIASVNITEGEITRLFFESAPPLINVPSQNPEVVMPFETVTISVNVTDIESGVHEVIFSYSLNGSAWTNITMSKASGETYTADIPGFQAGTNVQYRIVASDNAGNVAVNNNAGQYYVYTVVPELQSFLILPLFMMVTLLAVIVYRRKENILQPKEIIDK
jgi:uncharacterized protein YyaL (SSP411 family)